MKLDDPNFVASQYRTTASLDARVRIYELFDVSRERWPQWLFPRLELGSSDSVLELGCGTGSLWRENAARLPNGMSLTLTDLSPGMLDEARARLAGLAPAPVFRQADAQSLPFADASFDVAIANHMLYHVPDRARALREVARVLRPGGRFHAATYPWTHLLELRELSERFGLGSMLPVGRAATEFDLERAVDEVSAVLRVERVERRDTALRVTEACAVADYVRSMSSDEAGIARLRAHVARQIELMGAFHVTVSAGVVTAAKR